MKDKKEYLFFKKLLDGNKKDFLYYQTKLGIEYNVNNIKNEILKGVCVKNEK